MSKTFEATGKTREEAIEAGLEALGLTIGEVSIEDVEEGSKGLFGLFGSRPWRVRLTAIENGGAEEIDTHALLFDEAPAAKPEKGAEKKPQPKKSAEKKPQPKKPAEKKPAAAGETKQAVREPAEREKKQPAPRAESRPVEPADPETAAGSAQRFLMELTRLMNVEVRVEACTDEEGNVRVNMEGDPQGILIGRRGETLDALQYLTSLIVNKGRGTYTRVTLDAQGYRARREEALIRLANRMANRAVKTGRRVSLEPMNPYERRILHSALQGNDAVTTHSEGEEPNRHVVITVNKPPRAAKPEEDRAGEAQETAEHQEA